MIIFLTASFPTFLREDKLYRMHFSLFNSSTENFSSDFELYNENPEIKGRLKILNIQIQKTKYNFNRLNKSEALKELNKIIIYYNYSANMIVSKANDTIN